jgi:hypothetical protein
MTRYEKYAQETAARIKELCARKERFSTHPTLHTRANGVQSEIDRLTALLPKQVATAKWAKELYN